MESYLPGIPQRHDPNQGSPEVRHMHKARQEALLMTLRDRCSSYVPHNQLDGDRDLCVDLFVMHSIELALDNRLSPYRFVAHRKLVTSHYSLIERIGPSPSISCSARPESELMGSNVEF